jgi:hypothetical protein
MGVFLEVLLFRIVFANDLPLFWMLINALMATVGWQILI